MTATKKSSGNVRSENCSSMSFNQGMKNVPLIKEWGDSVFNSIGGKEFCHLRMAGYENWSIGNCAFSARAPDWFD